VFRIPGKTFLVGEYSALVGGEALGLATRPYFQLSQAAAGSEFIVYHQESPAGLFAEKNNFKFNFEVKNPYQVGGFGQSTAEFIFSWFERNKENDQVSKLEKPERIQNIFNDYLGLFDSAELKNKKPSGADLVTQLLGHVTHFNPEVYKSKSVTWPFSDLSFFVVSTGLKIKTHEHLDTLNRDVLNQLPEYGHKVIQAFVDGNQNLFISQLIAWSTKLEQMSLQHSDVLKFKDKLLKYNEIICIKPCGALGADVCLVFCERQVREDVKQILITEKVTVQANEESLCSGVLEQWGSQLKDLI
jgi:mevalonate kinase